MRPGCNLLLTYYFMLIGSITASAQNLVPNGDFEIYSSCPETMSELQSAEFWLDPTDGTADYFNACDTSDFVSVPLNFSGYQQAQSGNGYTGIFVAQNDGPLYREYLEAELTENLLPNYPYTFELYVNLANVSSCAPNMICVYLSDHQLLDSTTTGIISDLSYLTATLCTPKGDYIDDTLNWKKISFCFIADGDEKFVTIGNSYSNEFAPCYSAVGGQHSGYIYVDQVALTPAVVQVAHFDTTICKGNTVEIDVQNLIDQPDNVLPSYEWNDGYTGPKRVLYQAGNFQVYVHNECGTDTVYIAIHYDIDCPEIFYIPNAFSPNGDGINDRFRITDENITVVRFQIYNRWGGLVFSSSDARNGWDGKTNNEPQPIGVYLYLLDYTTNITEQSKRKSGYVTIIR